VGTFTSHNPGGLTACFIDIGLAFPIKVFIPRIIIIIITVPELNLNAEIQLRQKGEEKSVIYLRINKSFPLC
jgi:hypothetical protein